LNYGEKIKMKLWRPWTFQIVISEFKASSKRLTALVYTCDKQPAQSNLHKCEHMCMRLDAPNDNAWTIVFAFMH